MPLWAALFVIHMYTRIRDDIWRVIVIIQETQDVHHDEARVEEFDKELKEARSVLSRERSPIIIMIWLFYQGKT